MFGMRCPNCSEGICEVVNISRRYEYILRKVDENSLLPQTELGIIQTLGSQDAGMFAGEIAGELDVSPQLVGWRGKKLADRGLVDRRTVKNRRELELTQLAKQVYLPDDGAAELQVGGQ
jgi:DNA-binding MarR family transcriptional regulator